MTKLIMTLVLLAVARPASAQVGLLTESRIRIVVHQFVVTPGDSSYRALAGQVAWQLVQALNADSTFLVMGSTRDRTRPGSDAQYAILGAIAVKDGSRRIDLRLVDIAKVELVARETMVMASAPLPLAVASVAQQMARQVHDHLTRRHWGAATPR